MRPECRDIGRVFLAALLLIAPTPFATAQEFRAVRPIPTPGLATPGADVLPLPRELIEAAARTVLDAYNTPDLDRVLGADFYDRFRLEEAVTERVPRDAQLRLLSLQAWQLFTQEAANGIRTSLVSATVRAQLEFTADDGSFQRLEGVTELLLRINQPSNR